MGQGCKEVLGLARDTPHHYVAGQALEFRHLKRERKSRIIVNKEKTSFLGRRTSDSGDISHLDRQKFCDKGQEDHLLTIPDLLAVGFNATP